MDENKYNFFVSYAPGLENILRKECQALQLKPVPARSPAKVNPPGEELGGLLLEGHLSDVYSCNLHLRTASRITVRLGEFYAAAFSELRKKASRLVWEQFLTPGQAVNLSVTCHKSKLYHSDAVAERVLGAINDHFSSISGSKSPCRLDKNGQLILVRLVNDLCTISVDSSGTLLHKRGYRQEVTKAPLRETLASAMILATGWNGTTPLIDPFCGSGTIPIEAALIANHIPPGIARDFAFMKWPNFDPGVWKAIIQTARDGITHNEVTIMGYDRDQGAITIAASNAARAGQKGPIRFKQQPVSELSPSGASGWIITNPPFGIRISQTKDLRDLYARFGSILVHNFQGWQAGILCNDQKLTGNLGLPPPLSILPLIDGGIPVYYSLYSL